MIKKIFLILIVTTSLFAGETSAVNSTDIVWRTINFIIFAAIIWYLTADPIKRYLNNRTKKIADTLQSTQKKIHELKEQRIQAEQKVADAQKLADEILELSKKENKVIVDSMLSRCDTDLSILDEQNLSLMELEQHKMVKSVVQDILTDLLNKDDITLTKEEMVDIILKKVA